MRIKPDPALQSDAPRSAQDPLPLPLQLALVVPAPLPGGVTRLPYTPGAWVLRKGESEIAWQMETGLIVEQALTHALSALQGGPVNSLPAPAAGYGATLDMLSVQLEYDEHLRFLLPLPLPIIGTMVGEFEVRMRMTLELGLNDAQGRQVWARSYDDGRHTGIWVYPGGYAVRAGGPDWQAGVNRMAHDAAARLAQQVVQDLREWHEAQRLKPRSL